MHNRMLKSISFPLMIFMSIMLTRCSTDSGINVTPVDTVGSLTSDEIQTLITQAVEVAGRNNQSAVIAIADRFGNPLAVYSMTGTAGSVNDPNFGAVPKARTAAMLSSNYAALSTLTACWITRATFPPNQPNTLLQGPLFGVGFSSLSGSDIYDTTLPGQNTPGLVGLTGVPGGFPIYKDGLLAGGLGISTFANAAALPANFLINCGGNIIDETIALNALGSFAPPADRTANNIQLDGIQLSYATTQMQQIQFVLNPGDLANKGAFDNINYPLPAQINLLPDSYQPLYPPRSGTTLTAADVQQIVNQAITEANRIRSSLRRPVGLSSRFTIAVTDIDGTVLALYRMADAPVFSTDVSVQKARTAVVFSQQGSTFGQQFRGYLMDSNNQPVPPGQPVAVSTRAAGFLAGPYFPPGKGQPSQNLVVIPGPMYVPDPVIGANYNRLQQNMQLAPQGNGMTFFGGGVPLYKNGVLVGGIGVSGDGVRPDEMVAFAGAVGFQAPIEIRADQFYYNGTRIPYVTFERNVYIK